MAVSKKAVINATYLLSVVHWSFFALQMAVIPYIIKDLKLDNIHFGYVQTAFAVVTMIGNPIFSHFCSGHTKLALATAYASSAACYFMTAASNSFYTLLLSRLVCLMSQAPIGLQTVISTVTTAEERTVMFGRLGATFGVGFIVGSILGGTLASVLGYYLPSFIGGVVCLAVIPVIYAYVPEASDQHGEGVKGHGDKADVPKSGLLSHYARLLKNRDVFVVLLAKNACLIPIIIFTTIFGIYLVEKYNVTPAENAVLSVYTGISMVLMNAAGVGLLRSRFSDKTLNQVGFVTAAVTGLSMILQRAYWHFFIMMPLMVTCMTLISAVSDSLMTSAVPASDHALVLGLAWATDSVIRVGGPTVAGFMLSDLGFASFGYASIAGCLLAWVIFSTLNVSKIEKKSE